jgi:hypothetical protein
MPRRISIPDHVNIPVPDEKWAFGGLEFTDSHGWGVSADHNGRIRYNESTGSFEFSEAGAAYAAVPAGHAAVRQLIHFIDNGPAEGFATGAYRETTGTIYPTSIIWYDKAGPGKKKIVSKEMTWAGVLEATVTWKMYDINEVLLVTVTDTMSYSGVFETSRTRTIV